MRQLEDMHRQDASAEETSRFLDGLPPLSPEDKRKPRKDKCGGCDQTHSCVALRGKYVCLRPCDSDRACRFGQVCPCRDQDKCSGKLGGEDGLAHFCRDRRKHDRPQREDHDRRICPTP